MFGSILMYGRSDCGKHKIFDGFVLFTMQTRTDEPSSHHRGDGKLHVLDSGICYYEQPVFILDVELMKVPQFIPFASLVRLQPVECLYGAFPQQLHFSLFKRRFEFVAGTLDWKLNTRTAIGRVAMSDELASKQVKSRPEIMNRVSNNEWDDGRRRL